MTKFYVIITDHGKKLLRTDPRFMSASLLLSTISSNKHIAIIQSHHVGLRFEIDSDDDFIVLPGPHDPTPIGDLAKHLDHIKAESTNNMREVALRLHQAHGPAFHPDT